MLWSTWFWLYAIVFSEAKGIFHSYYTSALAPAVGALIGIGTVAALRAIRRNPAASFFVAAIVGLTVATQRLIMNRAPEFHSWAQPTMFVLVTIGVAALFVTAFLPKVRRFAGLSLLVIIGGFLIGPAAWASSEVTTPVLNATLPQAGPAASGCRARPSAPRRSIPTPPLPTSSVPSGTANDGTSRRRAR